MPVERSLLQQRLLKDMGIDVWRLRGSAGGERAEPAEIVASSSSTETPASAATKTPPTRTHKAPPRSRSASVNVQAAAEDAPRAATAIEPFSVFCFAQGSVLLMLQAADARQIGQLGPDLLAGVCGNWHSAARDGSEELGDVVTGDVREAVFRWPPAGLSSTEEEAVKGLCAFTDKQLSQDSPKKLILLSQSVADRLTGLALPEFLVLLPSVAELSGNWELKRDLWLELQTYAI